MVLDLAVPNIGWAVRMYNKAARGKGENAGYKLSKTARQKLDTKDNCGDFPTRHFSFTPILEEMWQICRERNYPPKKYLSTLHLHIL